jgi:hypothetical protein
MAMRVGIVSLMIGACFSMSVAQAQTSTPPTFTAGEKVLGPQQHDVGTIARVDGDSVIVNTGRHEVVLAKSAFAKWPAGLVIGSTRDQLEAAIDEANAKDKAALAAALVPGADAKSLNGVKVLGKVKELQSEYVVFTTPEGDFRLPRSVFVMRPAGLTVGLTVEEFEKAVMKVTPTAGS